MCNKHTLCHSSTIILWKKAHWTKLILFFNPVLIFAQDEFLCRGDCWAKLVCFALLLPRQFLMSSWSLEVIIVMRPKLTRVSHFALGIAQWELKIWFYQNNRRQVKCQPTHSLAYLEMMTFNCGFSWSLRLAKMF